MKAKVKCAVCGGVHKSSTVGFFVENYPHRVIAAFDTFLNVVFGGCPDETISSRSARAAARGNWLGKLIIGFCDFFQQGHGPKAERADLRRAERVVKTERRSLR